MVRQRAAALQRWIHLPLVYPNASRVGETSVDGRQDVRLGPCRQLRMFAEKEAILSSAIVSDSIVFLFGWISVLLYCCTVALLQCDWQHVLDACAASFNVLL